MNQRRFIRAFLCSWLYSTLLLSTLAFIPSELRAQEETKKTSSNEAKILFDDGATALNDANWESASLEFQELIKKYPNDLLVDKSRHYLGVCLMQLKKYADANAQFAQLIKDNPKFELLNDTYYYRGLSQYNEAMGTKSGGEQVKRYLNAAKTFATGYEKFPKYKFAFQMLYYQAESLYSANQLKQAAAAYQKFITGVEKLPADKRGAAAALLPEALYGAGWCYNSLKNHTKAISVYDQLIKNHPKNSHVTEVKMLKGNALLGQKKYKAAIPYYSETLEVEGFSDADQSLFQLASCHFGLQQYQKAAESFLSLPVQFPKSTRIGLSYLNAAKAFFELKQWGKSRVELGKGIKFFESKKQKSSEDNLNLVKSAHLMAICWMEQKNGTQALEIIEKYQANAAKTDWETQLAMDRANALYEIKSRIKDSVAAYAAYATDYPTDKLAPEALYMAGFAALKAEQYEQAIQYSNLFQKKYPQDQLLNHVLYTAAESHLLSKDFPTAEKEYLEIIKTYPNFSNLLNCQIRLGVALYQQKKWKACIDHLQPIVENLKEDSKDKKQLDQRAEMLRWIGSSLYQTNKYKKAAEILQQSIAASDSWLQADTTMSTLAHCLQRDKQQEKAIKIAQRVIKNYPKSDSLPEMYHLIGVTQISQKKYPQAIKNLRQIEKRWPDDKRMPNVMRDIALAETNLEKFNEAEKTLTDGLKKFPNHELVPYYHYRRGFVRQRKKDYPNAISDINIFLASKPKGERKIIALHVLGICQDKGGHPAQAVKIYEQLLSELPQEYPAYQAVDSVLYDLAWCLKATKKEKESLTFFKRLVKEFPKSKFSAEAEMAIGDHLYFKKPTGDYAAAIKIYQSALKKSPSDKIAPKIHYNLSWCYYHTNNKEKSLELFTEFLKKWPKSQSIAEATLMIAENQYDQKQYSNAYATYAEALKLSFSNPLMPEIGMLHQSECAQKLEPPQWQTSIDLAQEFTKKYPKSKSIAEISFTEAMAYKALAEENDGNGELESAKKQYAQSVELFSKAAIKSSHETGVRARFMVGEIYFIQKNYKEAVRNLHKAAFSSFYGYPKSSPEVQTWQAKACYELGQCYRQLKSPTNAKKYFNRLIKEFPETEDAKRAKLRIEELNEGSSG